MGVGGVALNEVDVGGRGNAEQACMHACKFVRDHNSLLNSCVYLRQNTCEPWIMSYRSLGVDMYKYMFSNVCFSNEQMFMMSEAKPALTL